MILSPPAEEGAGQASGATPLKPGEYPCHDLPTAYRMWGRLWGITHGEKVPMTPVARAHHHPSHYPGHHPSSGSGFNPTCSTLTNGAYEVDDSGACTRMVSMWAAPSACSSLPSVSGMQLPQTSPIAITPVMDKRLLWTWLMGLGSLMGRGSGGKGTPL